MDRSDVPPLQFKGGSDTTMTLSLFFDTTLVPGQPDVREYTQRVLNLMKIDPKLMDNASKVGRPPRVSFHWGKTWTFKAVITSIKQRFNLFRVDGQPLRATLEVTFVQTEDVALYKLTNPTSFAEAHRVRIVTPGQTIDSIAFEEYGDPARWRVIADYNQLDDPLRLRPGQRLGIPAT
jgi:nucleoid-associated protein YgaU